MTNVKTEECQTDILIKGYCHYTSKIKETSVDIIWKKALMGKKKQPLQEKDNGIEKTEKRQLPEKGIGQKGTKDYFMKNNDLILRRILAHASINNRDKFWALYGLSINKRYRKKSLDKNRTKLSK